MESVSLSALMSAAWRAVVHFQQDTAKGRRATFERHVAPVYKLVEQSHNDYVRGFRSTKNAIANSSGPKDVLSFLTDLRLEMRMVRGQAIEALELMLEQHSSGRRMPTGWNSALGFYEAAHAYFYVATAPAANSWYSDYIRFVEISAQHEDGDCWTQELFGNDPRNDLLAHIERVLDKLEISFRAVSRQYFLAQKNMAD